MAELENRSQTVNQAGDETNEGPSTPEVPEDTGTFQEPESDLERGEPEYLPQEELEPGPQPRPEPEPQPQPQRARRRNRRKPAQRRPYQNPEDTEDTIDRGDMEPTGGRRTRTRNKGDNQLAPLGGLGGVGDVGNAVNNAGDLVQNTAGKAVGGVTDSAGKVVGGLLGGGQKEEGGGGGRDEQLRLRLDLNLDIEVQLKAKIHGDLTLGLL
jgi:hypothetical protein